MAKGWRQRLRRGRLSWLGRIEGVEKPAILLGLGLVLYRIWRTGDPQHSHGRGWRAALGRVLKRGFRRRSRKPSDEPSDEASDAE